MLCGNLVLRINTTFPSGIRGLVQRNHSYSTRHFTHFASGKGSGHMRLRGVSVVKAFIPKIGFDITWLVPIGQSLWSGIVVFVIVVVDIVVVVFCFFM